MARELEPVTDEDKRKFVEMDTVLLDGKPARICGAKNEFATVCNADKHEEFSWYAVRYVVNNCNAQFKS